LQETAGKKSIFKNIRFCWMLFSMNPIMGGCVMPNMERIKEIADTSQYNLEELASQYHKNLNKQAYLFLENRGILKNTADDYRLGFETGKFGFYVRENALAEYFEDRIIFPVIRTDGKVADLVGRAFHEEEPEYKALLGVEDVFFNERVLAESEEVIICSDMLDVLTLVQEELPAVSLPNNMLFKEAHAERFEGKRVFICLRNDETGRRESVRMEALLKDIAKETFVVQLPEKVRSVNHLFLKKEKPLDTFRDILNQTIEDTMKAPLSPDVKYSTVFNEEYLKRHNGGLQKASTGLAELDELLEGGFGTGLYVLSGPPNIGKSTLMKQMADHVALQQTPVVYVTWDMTPYELWARSIARFMGTAPHMVIDGELDPELVEKANETYAEMSKMQWTLECTMQTTTNDICGFVEKIAVQAGRAPVVFIDHFHRLVFADSKKTSSQDAKDQMVYTLKHWSREWNAPVITALSVTDLDVDLINSVRSTVDGILSLNQENAPQDELRLIRLDVMKNRHGTQGSVSIRFEENQALFMERG
jgi:replicative DNA helicase